MCRKAVALTLLLGLAAGALGACKAFHGRVTQYDHGSFGCAGTGEDCESCSVNL